MFNLEYDNGVGLSATYLIDKGNLFVYEYATHNGSKKKEARFSTVEDSKKEPFLGMINQDFMKEVGINADDVRFSVDYIGPVRINPKRIITFEGFDKYANVGQYGENTYAILLNSYLRRDGLFDKVSRWMDENLEGQKLTIEQNSPSSGTYSIYILRNGAKVNIADVGQGLGQVLPVIVQSYMEGKADIAVVEQPALHLHPAAHAHVAYRLAHSTKETGKKYLIETHSENIVLGFRKLITESVLSPQDILIYFVDTDEEKQSAFLEKIEINANGELSTWPTGIFSESFDLLADIIKNKK
jgi:hypothetical protein